MALVTQLDVFAARMEPAFLATPRCLERLHHLYAYRLHGRRPDARKVRRFLRRRKQRGVDFPVPPGRICHMPNDPRWQE